MKRLTIAALLLTLAVPALAAANDTIDEAAKEKGAVKTASGMVYRSLREGTGKSPSATSVVAVDYRGTLANGTEFDSSYSSKMVVWLPLSGVISCWTEGLQMMKVGGKAKLVS